MPGAASRKGAALAGRGRAARVFRREVTSWRRTISAADFGATCFPAGWAEASGAAQHAAVPMASARHRFLRLFMFFVEILCDFECKNKPFRGYM